jgi:15-cis-phytoene synthase
MSATKPAMEARAALASLWERLRDGGCGAPDGCDGKLIRPTLSLAGAAALGRARDEALWAATAAVQLVHEASLLHDDVIDEASTRRGEPTYSARSGIAAALVEGDHYLTTAYRLAAATSSPAFISAFSYAVERTVAGEKLQGRLAGLHLDERTYRAVVALKSGELIGCALAAAPLVAGAPCAGEWYALGRRIGTLYQMLDDLLDYCVGAESGKPVLGDYRQRRWTWPLLELPGVEFGLETSDILARFTASHSDGTAFERCLQRLQREVDAVRAALAVHMPNDEQAAHLVCSWMEQATKAVRETQHAVLEDELSAHVRDTLERAGTLQAFFRANSRSFSFAAALFPAPFRRRVERIYAFCRLTDDLADGDTGTASERLGRLDCWERLCRRAYEDGDSAIPLLAEVMGDAAAARVPFEYVEALIEGMRMDLRGTRYRTVAELRTYSYRVAGVIGQWLTRAAGVHDAATLECAAALGHALQLTNILRDVGEDARRGRVYLPARHLRRYGFTEDDVLSAGAAGRHFSDASARQAWRELMEDLMADADRDYALALAAVPQLPPAFRRAVRVAAHVYRGIHDGIRANGYDNLRRRATTSPRDRARLALRALLPGGSALAPAVARVRRRAVATTLLLVLGFAGAAVAQSPTAPPAEHLRALEQRLDSAGYSAAVALDLTRALYFHAVDDASAVQRGHSEIGRLRTRAAMFAAEHETLLLAYEGAFHMLAARHGRWPHARVRAVRSGLARLDAAVSRAPDDLEVRYLRLVSTHYLPAFFGRRESAREDLRVAGALLARGPAGVPPAVRAVIESFVTNAG